MNYVTGETIKNLREKKRITQKELADMINVSDKTISKWETKKGLPDISIIEELSRALGVSIAELLTGELKINDNQSGNMKKIHFYVCPIAEISSHLWDREVFHVVELHCRNRRRKKVMRYMRYLSKQSIMSTMYPRLIL